MPSGRCVLTFHRVVAAPELDHDFAWSDFVELLDLLARGNVPVSTDLRPNGDAPGSAILTFDDGTEDHLRVGEELASRGLAAIFFVPVGPLGGSSRLAPGDVRALIELGHVVGSHTVDHLPLATLTEPELRRQLVESKASLEELTEKDIEYFAPPGGIGHSDLERALEEAGYSASRSTRWGFYRAPSERWDIPCLPVTAYTWRRRWIQSALASWELPARMRVVWQVKRRLPATLAKRIRSRVSRRG